MSYRFMRTILFFDLPTNTSSEQKEYRHFVKDIKKMGFYMLQESVYVKMSIDHQAQEATSNKINQIVPKKGSVMLLEVTEKQFSQIKILIGDVTTDVVITDDRTLIL